MHDRLREAHYARLLFYTCRKINYIPDVYFVNPALPLVLERHDTFNDMYYICMYHV